MITPNILFNATTEAMYDGTLPPASANDEIDFVGHGYCAETLRAAGDGGYWTCTRDRNKPHQLHIALSDNKQGKQLCAKWEYTYIVYEEPTLDDA